MTVRALAALALVLFTTPALAHPPPLGIGGFWGGALHPVFVPAHVMALVAVSLLAVQHTPPWGKVVPLAGMIGLATGLATLTLGVVPLWANDGVLWLAAIGGGLVALARRWPEVLGGTLMAVTGFVIGLDSPPEVLSLTEANLMLLGTWIGGSVVIATMMALASIAKQPWARIGSRVMGSWIAASAILVLAVRLVR